MKNIQPIEHPHTVHGITTTCAHYWMHIFPLEGAAYFYAVPDCRRYIERRAPKWSVGHSKNGLPTGWGWLVPRKAYFIKEILIPDEMLADTDWLRLSDSASGFLGEDICGALINRGAVAIPHVHLTWRPDRESQISGIDANITFFQPANIEFKTEKVTSQNIYVQYAERGHMCHLLPEAVA